MHRGRAAARARIHVIEAESRHQIYYL